MYFKDGMYVPEEGDLLLEPYGDESPDALVDVIPADKTQLPLKIPRNKIMGLDHPRFSVDEEDLPESEGGDSYYLLIEERTSVLPAMILAAFSGAIVGAILGVVLGALLWL